jgi:hypothetical protein
MSKRAPNVSVLTANRLTDGIVVYLAADGQWIESVEGAAIARTADEVKALQAQGARDAARNLVVEPYLAEVAEEAGARPLLARMRERVRVEGPSILGDVPGYVAPGGAPGANGVRPLASNVRASHNRGGEGSDPVSVHTPTSALAPAPHPGPLPASGESGSLSVEAA